MDEKNIILIVGVGLAALVIGTIVVMALTSEDDAPTVTNDNLSVDDLNSTNETDNNTDINKSINIVDKNNPADDIKTQRDPSPRKTQPSERN